MNSALNMQNMMNGLRLIQKSGKSWEIPKWELNFLEEVGQGGSSTVYKGKYRKQDVAIKVLAATLSEKDRTNFEQEFDHLMNLKIPSLVYFFGVCFSPNTCIVLEWCPKGSLFDVLSRPDPFDWNSFFTYAPQIVNAIIFLHSWNPPIVHRDIKSANLLIADSGQIKVCDLALARSTMDTSSETTLKKLRGTMHFTAPELYEGIVYTTKSDLYSVAITFWELINRILTGKYSQPYDEFNFQFEFQIIIQVAKNNLRPTIPSTCPNCIVRLLENCWDARPEKRPTAEELKGELADLHSQYVRNGSNWFAANRSVFLGGSRIK
eukprot:TRINITY_DN3348_c0_g1_i1.p1 TRINITY_DN3348_c0_g1~~TRINITY_DN3348_c0_g1_i1.p1  ORF type:complete len:321 (+),score=50.52 TRINITY_DN3348_c0_g1_i1:536-1498(+)